ncbi:MAG: peptidase M15 [Gammaproteobacteria bacterium]|nr:peptidase M15 [Gammaproteobacteria bacterium]
MASLQTLEDLGRVRLSPNFFMRDFLYSEISQVEGIANIPVDRDLAVQAGEQLCQNVLEPIQARLGKVSIRSAYRSPDINRIGNEKDYNCASNEKNHAAHIWDVRDQQGNYGATACIVVNSFVDYYQQTSDWTALAWWIHDHVPAYRYMVFYPKLAAFNINWYSDPDAAKTIMSQVPNPHTGKKGILTRTGQDNFAEDHAQFYADWLG